MNDLLSETLRIIELEAERNGIQLTPPTRRILIHLAESGCSPALVAKLWRLALAQEPTRR